MFLTTKNEKECYGCFSCQDFCPVNAIFTVQDSQGYFYPSIDEKICIHCKTCERVCPNTLPHAAFALPKDCFAGLIKDKADLKKSSSGGAFKAIVQACRKHFAPHYDAFYCAGVRFTDDFRVVHDVIKITDDNSIDLFSKSKYVQCYPAGIFKRCNSIIADERNFLVFSGSPCHCAAARKAFGDKKNVLLIDVICHGAPAQSVFDEYKKTLEKQYGSELVFYEFKTKNKLENGTYYTRSATYRFADGTERRLSRLDDSYLKDFYDEKYIPRPSCTNCQFKRAERISDITIGDAWRINELYENLYPQGGVSPVILTSEKAVALQQSIQNEMDVYAVHYDFLVAHNEPLKGSQQ